MKILLTAILLMLSSLAMGQEVTNLVLVEESAPQAVEIMKTMVPVFEKTEGVNKVVKSEMIMSPQGPTKYLAIYEIHWESMDAMMAWVESSAPAPGEGDPKGDMRNMEGVQILFYEKE